MNENKISRYIKYAIGEIVLVVIGILIALSINNWNEERKEGIQGKEFVSEIYNDLKKDILKINGILDKLEINKITSRQILEILESEDKYVADSSRFSSNMLNANAVIHVKRQNNTWDELKSSGRIAMIHNDSLDNLLKNFYDYYDKQVYQFSENPAQMRAKSRTRMARCKDISSVNKYWKENGDKSYSRSWFTCFLNDPEAKKDLNAIHVSTYWQIHHFTKIKTEGQAIIDYMDKTIALK